MKKKSKVHSGPMAEDNSRVRPRLLPIFAERYSVHGMEMQPDLHGRNIAHTDMTVELYK